MLWRECFRWVEMSDSYTFWNMVSAFVHIVGNTLPTAGPVMGEQTDLCCNLLKSQML